MRKILVNSLDAKLTFFMTETHLGSRQRSMIKHFHICLIRSKIISNEVKRSNLKTGVPRKQSTPNFPKNEHFLPSDMHAHVCVSEGKKCSFFGKCDVLCFLETHFLRLALLPYYRRSTHTHERFFSVNQSLSGENFGLFCI